MIRLFRLFDLFLVAFRERMLIQKSSLFFFGLLLAGSLTASAQQSFSEANIDSQSGLSDCRTRVLDPETGTFLQKDP